MNPGTIKDRLSFGGFDAMRLRQAAFRVISRTQDDPPTQILGTTLALISMCEATGVDIKQLLSSTERRRNDLDGAFVSTFDAIAAYARHEIRGR